MARFLQFTPAIAIRWRELIIILLLAGVPQAAAFIQWFTLGLPAVHPASSIEPGDPEGFPAFVRWCHFLNLLLMVIIIRSGFQILANHPRLYWNLHCTPGSEWMRFTSVSEIPKDRLWTAIDDARYLSPWIGLPGGRIAIGMARHWHFVGAFLWLLNGFVFVTLLFSGNQWRRLVPTSWDIIPNAWAVYVNYATLHMPPEPDTFYHFNALQQLAYFSAVFILAPLSMITGPSMSPAFTARFSWYPRLPGNRQIGRSIHFLMMCGFLAFITVHVAMVVVTGLVRNMNHIVIGKDDSQPTGLYLGFLGLAIVFGINVLANWAAWRRPRVVQHIAGALLNPLSRLLLDRANPVANFKKEDISPFHWVNGRLPDSELYWELAATGFKDFRLKIHGQVENPVELSLDDLRAMGTTSQITLHHCIQGWSGIAEWGGVPMAKILELVRPKANATIAVFYSFAEGSEGGQFYETHSLENLRHAQSILALDMNGAPLETAYGAPMRLRVENQLGFKMVKWVQTIEVLEDKKALKQGEGGYKEDLEYFGELANI